MGRFFETAPTQFIDNYIYQPPWEIIQQNNMLKAQNYATQQQTFNLLNNLPIDFWDKPDSELAKAKQEEYRNLTEPLIKTLQKDPNNKQVEMQLHDITNKLYQDYTYGDLAKLRTNKEQYDKFMAYADKLAPGDKEVFLRQMDNYLKPNQDGSMNNALTKQFECMEHQKMIKGEDYFKTDRFKTLEADIDSDARVNIGGQWITKTSSNIVELKQAKIAEDMKAWVQEQNLDKNNWDKYWTQVGGIQNLYDKEGKLGFEKGTYLGDMIESGSKTHAYKKTKSDKDVDVNQIYLKKLDHQQNKEMAEINTRNQIRVAKAASGGTESDAGVGPDIGIETAKILAGHSKMEELMYNMFGESARKLGKTPQQYMSYAMGMPKEWQAKHKNVMENIKAIYNESKKLPIASRAMLQQSFKSYTPEVEALIIKNAKISKGNFLVPSLNSTHGSSKATLTDLRSGRFLINGKKPKANSISINGESVYTVPSSTLEGSVAVYPVTFIDEKTGVLTNDFLYKNIGEIIKGK